MRSIDGERETPAMVLGLIHQKLEPGDLMSWRQGWGWFSPHPVVGGPSIRAVRARDRQLGRATFRTPVGKRGFAD